MCLPASCAAAERCFPTLFRRDGTSAAWKCTCCAAWQGDGGRGAQLQHTRTKSEPTGSMFILPGLSVLHLLGSARLGSVLPHFVVQQLRLDAIPKCFQLGFTSCWLLFLPTERRRLRPRPGRQVGGNERHNTATETPTVPNTRVPGGRF